MNFKKIIPILSLPLFLISCSKGLIRYGVNPYIEIETVEKGELIDYEPSKIKEKMENKDSFVLFLHKDGCGACAYSLEKYINPFLQTHNIIIYGINLSNIYSNETELNIYTEITEPFNNTDKEGNRYVPHMSIFHEGQYVQGELDMEFYTLLIESYIIL